MDFDTSDSDDSNDSLNEENWSNALQRIRENDALTKKLFAWGRVSFIHDIDDREWEQLGRDISNNSHMKRVEFFDDALNDHKMSFLFRGLTRSSSITNMDLVENGLSVGGVRCMVPFLQNANNLHSLNLRGNNLQSEGFNLLFRALSDNPIEKLFCNDCGIESIEINSEHIPRNLKMLRLADNSIDADGCCELVKLLQGGDSILNSLNLRNNKIDDEGVAILVDALKNNTSLGELILEKNTSMSIQGRIKLLKLVNDVSSIKATLRSNHTLKHLWVGPYNEEKQIQTLISIATHINSDESSPEAAGREKVIWTQLNTETRAKLAELQGVSQSLYSEIDPLHLPEVLSLVGHHHGHEELYLALKASIAGALSTVNRKECILQRRDYLLAEVAKLDAELAAIGAAEGREGNVGRNKRHRAC